MTAEGQIRIRIPPVLLALPIRWGVRVGGRRFAPGEAIRVPAGLHRVEVEAELLLPDVWAVGRFSLELNVVPEGQLCLDVPLIRLSAEGPPGAGAAGRAPRPSQPAPS